MRREEDDEKNLRHLKNCSLSAFLMAETGIVPMIQRAAEAAAMAMRANIAGGASDADSNASNIMDQSDLGNSKWGADGFLQGVTYAVPFATAMEKKWKTFGMRPMGSSGNFVEVSAFVKDEHRFLKVPTLPPAFYEQGTTELIFPGLDRILAKARTLSSRYQSSETKNLDSSLQPPPPVNTRRSKKPVAC